MSPTSAFERGDMKSKTYMNPSSFYSQPASLPAQTYDCAPVRAHALATSLHERQLFRQPRTKPGNVSFSLVEEEQLYVRRKRDEVGETNLRDGKK
jgi:hypothetical protein